MKKNGFEKFMSAVVYPACGFFTICVLVFSALASFISSGAIVPNFAYMCLLLLFSFAVAALNLIFSTSLNLVAKIALHFGGTLTAFLIVFILFGGYYKKGSSAVAVTVFFVCIYVLILSVAMIVRSVSSHRKNAGSEYVSQFKN